MKLPHHILKWTIFMSNLTITTENLKHSNDTSSRDCGSP